MMSLCYVAVLLLSAPVDGPGLSDGMAVELKALEARQALRNGVVELSVETLKLEGPPGLRFDDRPVDLKISFDGPRRFVESCRQGQGRPQIERRMFDGSLYVVEHGDDRSERLVIDSHGYAGSRQFVLNPQLLGVYPGSALVFGSKSLETVLGRTDRTEEQVRTEQMSGRAVTHVSRKVSSGQLQVDLWIAPELNYSVVRVEVHSTPARSELVCEYDQPFGNIWFPRRTTYRQHMSPDDRLTNEEVVTVKSAVFNRGIDPSLFTLAAFKPVVGDIVRQDGAQMAWNGKHLVSADDATVATLKSRSLIGNWPWFTVAVFLAIAAFVILRRSFVRP